MTDLTIESDVTVHAIRVTATDDDVIQSAQVSVTGENEAELTDSRKDGLIKYLLREKHGSPFEHNQFKFYIKAPIFVFREFHRHRVGWSYNEMSGRYTELPGEFYIPGPDRKLKQVGTSAHPSFEPAEPEVYEYLYNELMDAYEEDWARYQRLLDKGIPNEVARISLPVGIMSQMYATTNARGLMNFLALRTKDERATFPSNPQWEIELVARKMEEVLAEAMPITYKYFNEFGRVAP